MKYLFLIGIFFLPIICFSQTVNVFDLNGPEGGYIDWYGINDQGEILSSHRNQTQQISRDGGETWIPLNGRIGAIYSPHPNGTFYGYGWDVPFLDRLPFGSNNVSSVSNNADLEPNTLHPYVIDENGVFFGITTEDTIVTSVNGMIWSKLIEAPWPPASFGPSITMYAPKGSEYIYFFTMYFTPNSDSELYRIKKDGSEAELVYDSDIDRINNFSSIPRVGHIIGRGTEVLFSPDGSFGSWQIISIGLDVAWVTTAPNGDITFGGDDGYYRSNDLGANWTQLPGHEVMDHPQGFEIQYNEVYDRYIVENFSDVPTNFFSVSTDFTDWREISPMNDQPMINKILIDGQENIYAGQGRFSETNIEGWRRSTDGGVSFQPAVLPNNKQIKSITEGANDVLFALGVNDTLYNSTDYGLTWTSQQKIPGLTVFAFDNLGRNFIKGNKNGTLVAFFNNANNALWVSYDNGNIWNPIDGNNFWESNIDIHPNGDVYGVSFSSTTLLRKYSFRDQLWSTAYENPNGLSFVEISPEGTIFTLGTYRGLRGAIVSEDDGKTFIGSPFTFDHIDAGRNGFIAASSGTNLFLSRNNGLSWENIWSSGFKGSMTDLHISDDNILYISRNGDFMAMSNQFIFNDNYIVGDVIFDQDDECDVDTGEPGLPNRLVRAVGLDTFYVTTRGDGRFSMPVPAGDYEVSVLVDEDYWLPCDSIQAVTLTGINDTAFIDFPIKANVDCPLMQVDLSNPFLRRCFDNNYHVRYCNEGTVTGENASVEVTLDSRLQITSSSIPVASQVGDVYTFNVGDVPISTCGNFSFVTSMMCDSVDLGETVCVEARVFPDTICIAPDPTWNGASLAVEGECVGDSVIFTIRNVGIATMPQSKEYIIIEDIAVERVRPTGRLDPGQEIRDTLESLGQTFHLEVEQVDNHPGSSRPRVTVEKCGTPPYSFGFVNQFGQDDLSGMLDIECREAIGSFDPNDKSGVPRGLGPEHIILPNETIEYLIRFQNTGTDTAFTVKIVDRLSTLLDLSTLEVGASSHDYEYRIFDEGVLQFDFNNIMLPDSNVNEPASNGFVKFKIAVRPDVSLGSTVFNAVDIFFDFNDPIRTNETFHLIDESLGLVQTTEIFDERIDVNIFPNPFVNQATLELKNSSNKKKRFVLVSAMGHVLRNEIFDGQSFVIEKKGLLKGVYFYEILEGNQKLVTGKVMIH